jgi:hypothetical protein
MLRRLLDDGVRIDRVLFANTGKERNETLDFVHECEKRWGLNVVWLEYDRVGDQHAFKVVTYETAHRNRTPNGPFDKLLEWMPVCPNVRARGCSTQLKVRTMRRYLESQGFTRWRSAIGIRADESHRCIGIKADCPSFIRPEFPLVTMRATEADVMQFWAGQPFDLRLKQYEGNCDACFLKAKWKLQQIERDKPGTLDWWIEKEREKKADGCKAGAQFREDRSYAEIKASVNTPVLFSDDDEIGCTCLEGAWNCDDDLSC